MVPAEEMDFVTGLDEIEADTYDEPPPRNKLEALWQWLVRLKIRCYAPSSMTDNLSHRCDYEGKKPVKL